jgi:hypothetical protein
METEVRLALPGVARTARSDARRRATPAERDAKWPPCTAMALATVLSGALWAAILAALRPLVG